MPPPFARAASGRPQTAASPSTPKPGSPTAPAPSFRRKRPCPWHEGLPGSPALQRAQAGLLLRLPTGEKAGVGGVPGERSRHAPTGASFPGRPWLGVGRLLGCVVTPLSCRREESQSRWIPWLGLRKPPPAFPREADEIWEGPGSAKVVTRSEVHWSEPPDFQRMQMPLPGGGQWRTPLGTGPGRGSSRRSPLLG